MIRVRLIDHLHFRHCIILVLVFDLEGTVWLLIDHYQVSSLVCVVLDFQLAMLLVLGELFDSNLDPGTVIKMMEVLLVLIGHYSKVTVAFCEQLKKKEHGLYR